MGPSLINCSMSTDLIEDHENSAENNSIQKDSGTNETNIVVFDERELVAPSPNNFVTIEAKNIESPSESPKTPDAPVPCYSPVTSPLQCETPRRGWLIRIALKPRRLTFEEEQD